MKALRLPYALFGALLLSLVSPATSAFAQPVEGHAGGEAALKLPDLGSVTFFGGISGHRLLLGGLWSAWRGWCSAWSPISTSASSPSTGLCGRSPSSSTRPARRTSSPRGSSS